MECQYYATADEVPSDEQPTPPIIVEILETIESITFSQ